MKKVIVILLVLSLLLGLASCGNAHDVISDGGDRVGDSWEGVDFSGQEVRVSISANQSFECMFPAADIYTKGPDTAGSNEVLKEVLSRNARAERELGVEIVYAETDLRYDEVLEDVRILVQTAAKNSPDVYSNDSRGLSRAMIGGYLWNVKNPGKGVKNYFDFAKEGWYGEFIRGCTFDQEKLYLFAGDYFIDMIRMAWVVYVNNDLFSQNLGKMPGWCKSLDTYYEYVADGFWDLDVIADLSSRVFVDGGSGKAGVTEGSDPTVGFAINHVSDWIFAATSQITVYYQDESDGYRPRVMESVDEYQRVADKFVEMTETQGVYFEYELLSSTQHFLDGNFLFAISRLGEMEAPAVRDFGMSKGVVPIPKWNQNVQDEYHTVIHDQVEIGCILNTAQAFSAASALMQFLNEESERVVNAYYEKGLKYKYNDDKNSRLMMDIIRESTDSPFGFQIGLLCEQLYEGSEPLVGMWIENNKTCASTFASEKDAYQSCMQKMLDRFAAFE